MRREAIDCKGLHAYRAVHMWFTQTTGLAVSQRMQYIMQPPICKQDQEMAQALEKWEREATERENIEPVEGNFRGA